MTGDDDNNDQRLRAAMKKAHEGEHAPPFRALVERRARRRLYLAPLALGAAVLGALVIARRPAPAPPPIALASLRLDTRGPLDFLLEMRSDALLTDTPRFDAKGVWP